MVYLCQKKPFLNDLRKCFDFLSTERDTAMKHRPYMAMLLMAVLAICLLGGCGQGTQSGLIYLKEDVIQEILQKDGFDIIVTEQDALNQAVEQAAQNLEGAARPDPELAAVRSQIAQEIGMLPLICDVYDNAYWPNSLWGKTNRHEQTVASFAQQLYEEGHGSTYAAAVALFTTQDGEEMLLFVMTKGL